MKKESEGKLPFQKTSLIGIVVRLALRKQGVTQKEILQLAINNGASAQRLFYALRQGGLKSKKMMWELEENHGRLRIVNYKLKEGVCLEERKQ